MTLLRDNRCVVFAEKFYAWKQAWRVFSTCRLGPVEYRFSHGFFQLNAHASRMCGFVRDTSANYELFHVR
jgi:hypothetical protein